MDYFINRNFLYTYLTNFMELSMNQVFPYHNDILSSKKYWLYWYIKENYQANINYLSNLKINNDIFGFAPMQRNIRHSIESFIDLYSLIHDSNYIEVLNYCCDKNRHPLHPHSKYAQFLYKKHSFTIRSKFNIARKLYSYDNSPYKIETLETLAASCNKYTHDNILIDISNLIDINQKKFLLLQLMSCDVELLSKIFILYRNSFMDVPWRFLEYNIIYQGEAHLLQLYNSYLSLINSPQFLQILSPTVQPFNFNSTQYLTKNF